MSQLQEKDIYIIPVSDGDEYLVYSPLRKVLFSANRLATETIKNCIEYGIAIPKAEKKLADHVERLLKKEYVYPNELTVGSKKHAVILLSHKCNLSCSYCYAQNARSSDTLSKDMIKIIVDNMFENATGKIAFSFMGGGEPTFTWDLLTYAIDYIRQHDYPQEDVRISITTNGTLLNNERIEWIKNRNAVVGISFEILPEIQDMQRGFANNVCSHPLVDKSIKTLICHGMYPRLRSTITDNNLHKMCEMVSWVKDHYPRIKKLHFEHVTEEGLTMDDYYSPFVSEFFKARSIAKANGIELNNSILTSITSRKTRFCKGEYCITPKGNVVSCHRVAHEEDVLFDKFYYGNVTDTKVAIDEERRKRIQALAEKHPENCHSCFARWHCAGLCTENKYLYSEKQLKTLCEFTKMMIQRELEHIAYNK